MKAGFIGLGRMGHAMAQRALDAKHELVLFNRTPDKIADLAAAGAKTASSIGDVARAADVVVTMLSDDAALASVSADLLDALPPGGIHIAMGTHSVEIIGKLARTYQAAEKHLVSAPVLGRPEAVIAGRLGIIAGGADEAVERCLPLLNAIGRRVFRAGLKPEGAASMKIANNFLLGCAIEAMGEAFSLVEKCGVEGDAFFDMITDGLFNCPAYSIYGKMIAAKDFETVGFTANLAFKDAELARAAGATVHTPLPSGDVWRDRLAGAIARGEGERDWVVMALEQRRAAGLA